MQKTLENLLAKKTIIYNDVLGDILAEFEYIMR